VAKVRGTPASGKSSLAYLLRKYITDNHPDKEVFLLSRYRDKPKAAPIPDYTVYLEEYHWKNQSNGVLILDEAQLSYWDHDLWLIFFKSIGPSTPYMVILFASYGSAGRNLLSSSTPFRVEEDQLVGLTRGSMASSVGLLLTREEMEGVVETKFLEHRFDVSMLDYIYSLTSGHVGACCDALNGIYSSSVSTCSSVEPEYG
jgi:hypothetical protein